MFLVGVPRLSDEIKQSDMLLHRSEYKPGLHNNVHICVKSFFLVRSDMLELSTHLAAFLQAHSKS